MPCMQTAFELGSKITMSTCGGPASGEIFEQEQADDTRGYVSVDIENEYLGKHFGPFKSERDSEVGQNTLTLEC